MSAWDSAARGTRLWRNTILAQIIFTVVMVALMFFAGVRMMSNRGSLGMTSGQVESNLMVYAVIMAVGGLVFQGLLIVVGNRWCSGPALPSAVSKAKTYRVLAIIGLGLTVVSLGIGVTGGEEPWVLRLGTLIIALVMIFTALSLQSDYLASLESPLFGHSEKMRGALGALIGTSVALTVLGGILGPLGLVLLIACGICFIVWFVMFVIFLGNAASVYERGGSLNADVFD